MVLVSSPEKSSFQGGAAMKKPWAISLVSLIAIAILCVLAAGAAAAPVIAEYPVPTPGSGPSSITPGPDGNLWVAETGSNNIGKVTTAGAMTEYPVPTNPAMPNFITAGPDGNLWFTEAAGNKIGKVTTGGVFAEYPIPTATCAPAAITTGPDGNVWFAEVLGNKIGKVTTAGAIIEYTVPTLNSDPIGITSGPDGNVWFTENTGNKIARMTTAGVVTEYPAKTAASAPRDITAGPDGNLWFVEVDANKIGKITTAGVVTEYPIPTLNSDPMGITTGPDGNVWFTENTGNKIGKITTAGAITEYAIPTPNSKTPGICAGPRGNIWFAEGSGNKIGRLSLSTFYFAEGYTGPNFAEYLTLENPNATKATANVTYLFSDGTTEADNYTVAASSRLTVDVGSIIGDKEVSMVVTSDALNLVAERPMYFNYNGVWTGGSDAIGASSPRTDWYFAEGTTLPGFDEYVTVLNPGSKAANLGFHYMVEGHGEVPMTETVKPHSRATFSTRQQIGSNLNASLYLSSDQLVVAERPMYFNYMGLAQNNWTGGHDVVGTNSPAKSWYLAEGTTRPGFEEWLCLQNPNPAPIKVNATYQLGVGQGSPIAKSYTIPANQRLTVSVNQQIGTGKDDSVYLSSGSSFIAERPMYFNYQSVWTGGHDVLGANGPAKTWLFAEGTTRSNFNEWLCLQNPQGTAAHATITYYPESGSPVVKKWTVAGNSRLTVNVNTDAGANLDISAAVTSDQPIIVERPMYFNYNSGWTGGGWTGGHDVVGFVP
jgi:streptogramin lyase